MIRKFDRQFGFPCLGMFWSIMGYQVMYLLNKKTKLLIQYGNTDDFYLLHRNISNYRYSTSERNNRRLNVVRSAISQMSQVNVCNAVNKDIAISHNLQYQNQ